MFHVVETINQGQRECYVIPSNWMIHERGVCYWPTGPVSESSVRTKKAPNPKTWVLYSAKILKTVETYEEAQQWLLVAEYQSDLNSEPETGSRPKRPRVMPRKRLEASHQNEVNYNTEDSDDGGRETMSALSSPPLPFTLGLVGEKDQTLAGQGEAVAFTEDEIDSFLGSRSVENHSMINDHVPEDPAITPSLAASTCHVQRSSPIAGLNNSTTMERQYSSTPKRPREVNQSAAIPLETQLLIKIANDIAIVRQTMTNFDQRLSNLEASREGNGRPASTAVHKIMNTQWNVVQDFQDFDASLTPEQLSILKSEMISLGGDSVVEFVGRVLRRLMTDELAKMFSLWGHKNNVNFSVSNCWKILKSAALSMRKFSADEKSVEKAGMNWFRHVGDRLKNKTRRSEPINVPC